MKKTQAKDDEAKTKSKKTGTDPYEEHAGTDADEDEGTDAYE